MSQLTQHDRAQPIGASGREYEIRLLGGFQLRHRGSVVEALPSSQRVLAFLALNDRQLPRAYVAGSLWPDTTDEKAGANLRTALWRLHSAGHAVVMIVNSNVSLRADIWVDVRLVDTAARRHRVHGELPSRDLIDEVHGELLPGCWDSWLAFERERLRHELIYLYELLGRESLRCGEDHLAVLAALAAVECDPLHESANALLIRSYAAGGNRADAMRAFRRYAALLRAELGVSPSAFVDGLVRSVVTASGL